MSMRLTQRFDGDVLEYGNIDFDIDLSFDVVLRTQELKEDPNFNDYEKIEIMFEMLVKNPADISIVEKSEIVKIIFDKFINKEESGMGDDDEQAQQTLTTKKKIYDFDQDADAIYASFLFDYNIDLIEQQGKLHWDKFIALLNGLSDKSPFKQIIQIRTMKVPKPNKHNADERKKIIEAKRIYALKENRQTVEDIDNQLDNLAASLKPRG